ncbi:MAG: AbrB/MazE/SpoVT family DNA-binding domain-containing protein [Oscillospiraceae bacterium]|nr:AbrB/MazE/SpoVT family DNA-binding domain-containing protein [Oscillospiraceae bacterium]
MTYNTAVSSKGQVTIPIDIREKMKIDIGSQVALIYENDRVFIVNPAIYAMEKFQSEMNGEWEKAGINSEEDLAALCREIRAEIEGEYESSN